MGVPTFVCRKRTAKNRSREASARRPHIFCLCFWSHRLVIIASCRLPSPQMARSQHENMWERAMKSYKWVHHLPQVSERLLPGRKQRTPPFLSDRAILFNQAVGGKHTIYIRKYVKPTYIFCIKLAPAKRKRKPQGVYVQYIVLNMYHSFYTATSVPGFL